MFDNSAQIEARPMFAGETGEPFKGLVIDYLAALNEVLERQEQTPAAFGTANHYARLGVSASDAARRVMQLRAMG